MPHTNNQDKAHPTSSTAKFNRADKRLRWSELNQKNELKCSVCIAEMFGTCGVNGYSIPADGICNIKPKILSRWKASRKEAGG